MIVVTVEVWPGGNSDRAQHKGFIYIRNNVAETMLSGGTRGAYDAEVYKQRGSREVRVTNYARNAYHVWELVRRVLNEWAKAEGRSAA